MANYFENLKNLIIDKLSTADKKNYHNQAGEDAKFRSKDRRNTDQEESISLLDDSDKFGNKLQQTDKSYNAVMLFSSNMLPVIYGFFGIFTIVFMISCALINKVTDEFYILVGPMKTKFLSFFQLPKINLIVYHLLNSTVGLIGLGLVITLYMRLHMKFSNNKFNNFQFVKLHLSTTYGVLSNVSHIVYGAAALNVGFEKLNKTIESEIYLSLYQFIFFTEIFFTILYGIFTTLLVYNLKCKPSYAILNEVQVDSEKEFKWIGYKFLNIIYLVFFSLAYIIIILHSNSAIFERFSYPTLKDNYSYLLAFLPYLIYILNISLYVTFYDELRDSTITLVEPNEKMTYYNNQKNIL